MAGATIVEGFKPTFEILFFNECPYCHSTMVGIHSCEQVDKIVKEIKSQYKDDNAEDNANTST